jgi:hypothetical protein
MTDEEIMAVSRRLLRPYRTPETCPYVSDDQRELSLLDLKERSAWMGEWLMLAGLKKPRLPSFREQKRVSGQKDPF